MLVKVIYYEAGKSSVAIYRDRYSCVQVEIEAVYDDENDKEGEDDFLNDDEDGELRDEDGQIIEYIYDLNQFHEYHAPHLPNHRRWLTSIHF